MENISKPDFDDLPNEILTKIFANLLLKDDLDHVQLVSPRWCAIVDETIGRDIVISQQSSSHQIYHPPFGNLGFDAIEKMGVKKCVVEIEDLDKQILNEFDESPDEYEEPKNTFKPITFKYPHLLQELIFNGSITSEHFQCLFTNFDNLTILELNIPALSRLKPENLSNLKLKNLKSLRVRRCPQRCHQELNTTTGVETFCALLANTYPKLIELDVRFPIRGLHDYSSVEALLKFLDIHQIKRMFVVMEFPVSVPLKEFNEYKSGTQEKLMKMMEIARKLKNKGNLQTLEIQGIRIFAGYPQIKVWFAFLEHQISLSSLTLRLGYVSSTMLNCICDQNKTTLKSIYLYKMNEMEQDYPELIPLDCDCFSKLEILDTLYVLGTDSVSNARQLPKSLVSVFITGSIQTHDVRFILLELEKLSFISLKNAYNMVDGAGINAEILEEFIGARRVKRLILNGSSLLGDFPPGGFLNGDPLNPATLTEFDNWDPYQNFLDWELNTDRYYVNKYY